jgi:hypothetical protein
MDDQQNTFVFATMFFLFLNHSRRRLILLPKEVSSKYKSIHNGPRYHIAQNLLVP